MAVRDKALPAQLTVAQVAYLKALASTLADGKYAANEITALAKVAYRGCCSERRVLQNVIRPLERAGYLALQAPPGGSRAGRSVPLVFPTERLVREYVRPFLAQVREQVGEEVCALLPMPLARILSRVQSPRGRCRGPALQALAIRLMALVDPAYDHARIHVRGLNESTAELVFESSSFLLPRWHVRCTRSDPVVVDNVATEVGLNHLVHGDVLVLVGTGTVEVAARRYAQQVTRWLRLPVLTVDGKNLERLATHPSALHQALARQSRVALARS